MSSATDQNPDLSDGKLATEAAPAGVNSITNTVGMHPTSNGTSSPSVPSNMPRGTCDQPGCTAEHSGKPHE